MIKLVASDLDGTLLQNGSKVLEPEIFPLIRKLKEKGILFVAASGRQYASLRHLFHEVADDIGYICENGALVMYQDQVLDCVSMEDSLKEELIKKITILIPLTFLNSTLITELAQLTKDSPGNTELYFKVIDPESKQSLDLVSRPVKLSVRRELISYIKDRPELDFRIN